jgi:hypothetical protein
MTPRTVTYFEYYPHYSGRTYKGSFEMTWDEFLSLLKVDMDNDENMDKLLDTAETRAGTAMYALSTLFSDHNIVDIKNILEDRGTWADMWEEGSFALSVFGKQAAMAACAKVETDLSEMMEG